MDNKQYITPLEGQYISKIEGVIKIKYRDNLKFNICKITYELFADGNYQYIFEPYYDILDALPSTLSQGIPGLNLDKRKKQYYRVNRIPSFISERTMREDRENLKEELDKLYMDEYNPLEWLIRTDTEYSGDNLIVERYRLPKKIARINYKDLMYGDTLESLNELGNETHEHASELLCLIGSGVNINTEHFKINNKNRVGALHLLIHFCDVVKKPIKIKVEEEELPKITKVKTRKKRKIDDFVIEEAIKELELKIINEAEAMKLMNIKSKSTLYKRIKEYKENN